jgi:hypothetical protein
MFDNYVENALSLNDYKKKNSKAPENTKYCNGICQKFLPISDFFEINKYSCKSCYYLFLKVKDMVKNNQITFERFRQNPSIVNIDKTTIDIKRKCITCEVEKTLENFEASRKECIPCRNKKKKINYNEMVKEYVPVIENIKTDIDALKNLFRGMPVDVLKLLISDYKITVKHKDRKKDVMIVKLIEYFQSLLSPNMCLGNCGIELETEFSVCDVCKNKKDIIREEKYSEFEDNIENIVSKMNNFTIEDSIKYTKKQLVLIATHLNIKFYTEETKKSIVEKMVEYFIEKKKRVDNVLQNKPNLSGQLCFNGIIIYSREDGMVNATEMCKAGGKKFSHWYGLDSTKELITIFEAENLNAGIPAFKSLTVEKGKYGGSWIHPDLAVQLAQWISPIFAIQVSKWIRELAFNGSVSLGAEKTNIELLELQKNYKKLENKCRKQSQKKVYHKFKKGPVFYIMSDIDSKSKKFKPGFEGSDASIRLGTHRSSVAGCKLEFLIYTKNAKLVETMVLTRFESKRNIKNKEWIFDVDISDIIKNVRTILNVVNIKYTEEENIKKYNEQIELDFNRNNEELCEEELYEDDDELYEDDESCDDELYEEELFEEEL